MKILFVDDEAMVRKAIVQSVDWKKYGIHVVGEAGNGQEALDILKTIAVDMVITDIRMPVMDGLELHRRIREQYPEIKVAIISGHDEFEYARDALRYGACDYLLKPVSEEDLLTVIQKERAQLATEHKKAKKMQVSSRLVHENIIYIRSQFIKDVLENRENFGKTILKKAENIGIRFAGPSFGVIILSPDDYNPQFSDEQGMKLQGFATFNIIDEIFPSGLKCAVVYGGEKDLIVVFQGKSLQKTYIHEILVKMRKTISDLLEISTSIALSGRLGNLSELPQLYRQAKDAMEERFYHGKGGIFFYEKQEQSIADEWNIERLRFKRSFFEAFKERNMEMTKQIINETFSFLKRQQVPPYVCKEYAVDLIDDTLDYVVELGGNMEALKKEIYGKKRHIISIQQISFLDELSGFLLQAVHIAGRQLEHMAEKNYSRMIRMAIQYLEQHYQEDISLGKLADQANVSANYFSKIFKKEVGVNYVDWLNQLRVEKAKMILMDNTYKVYEVAELVGYSEYKYFITLFKKHTGMTPKQFREKLSSAR